MSIYVSLPNLQHLPSHIWARLEKKGSHDKKKAYIRKSFMDKDHLELARHLSVIF